MSYRRVRFRQRIVYLKRAGRSRFGWRQSFAGVSSRINSDEQVTIGEPDISQRIIRVFLDRLSEKLDRFSDVLARPSVKKEKPSISISNW